MSGIKNTKLMRTGFTTGACAAAAAKAATYSIVNSEEVDCIKSILPNGDEVEFELIYCNLNSIQSSRCAIRKESGDDPDCTNQAHITADVILNNSDSIEIIGGDGVATVTKGGIGLEIGGPAINQVPRKNIREMVESELVNSKYSGAVVKISVPGGQEMAKKTINERLGLIGGISIIGTTGIVKPYSTSSYIASVKQSVEVVSENNLDTIVLTTGGRTEKYAMALYPDLYKMSFIQAGDFIGVALKTAVRTKIKKVIIVGMVGKMAKIADSKFMTHAIGSEVNTIMLSSIVNNIGADESIVDEIKNANTARHVLEICKKNNIDNFCPKLSEMVVAESNKYTNSSLDIICHVVDFNGSILGECI